MEIINCLNRNFLFSSLDKFDLSKLSKSCTKLDLSKGEILFNDGDLADSFYMIVEGKIKVSKLSMDGNEVILHIHGASDLIAEGVIYDKEQYPANCVCLERTTFIKIPKKSFIDLIINNPSIALKVMGSYSKRLHKFVSMIEDFTLRDIEQRLAKYILNNSNAKEHCNLNISKRELASFLGTIPETFSRALKRLKNKGVIVEKDKSLIIKDIEALKLLI